MTETVEVTCACGWKYRATTGSSISMISTDARKAEDAHQKRCPLRNADGTLRPRAPEHLQATARPRTRWWQPIPPLTEMTDLLRPLPGEAPRG